MKTKWLQRGILVLIGLASLYASISNLISTQYLGNIHDDPVADWEQRFEPLKKRLPYTRGVIGYISDSSVPGAVYSSANDSGEYVLTQYVMAPIILIQGTGQEWNIANFGKQAYEIWSQSNHGRFEVTPFGGNIYLLHKLGN
jgi:hypothetical protein